MTRFSPSSCQFIVLLLLDEASIDSPDELRCLGSRDSEAGPRADRSPLVPGNDDVSPVQPLCYY